MNDASFLDANDLEVAKNELEQQIRSWNDEYERLWQRYQDSEIRPPRLALALDQAMVTLHKGLSQRQPQAGSAVPA